jgi:hypothetical protein
MIAAKVLGYYWIDGKENSADIVSKHWSYPQVWHLLKPILFYSGDTVNLLNCHDIEFKPDSIPVQQIQSMVKDSTSSSHQTNISVQKS